MCKKPFIIPAAVFILCTVMQLPALSPEKQRAQFIQTCRSYLGTRYQYGGTSKSGMDCSGLIFASAKNISTRALPRTAAGLYSFSKKIPDASREPGDLVFFKTTGSGISHVGVYLGDNSFIHSASDGVKTGVIISSLHDRYWKRTYAGAGSIFDPTGFGDSHFSADVAEGVPAATDSATHGNTGAAVYTGTKTGTPGTGFSLHIPTACDCTAFFCWNIQASSDRSVAVYGGAVTALFRTDKWLINPGISAGLRIIPFLDIVQLPVCLSLSITPYISIYTGIVFTSGTPVFESGSEKTSLSAPVYPGTFGISLSTPSFHTRKGSLSLVQDISYTFFTGRNGEDLSFSDALRTGFVFSTGIRVTIPL